MNYKKLLGRVLIVLILVLISLSVTYHQDGIYALAVIFTSILAVLYKDNEKLKQNSIKIMLAGCFFAMASNILTIYFYI